MDRAGRWGIDTLVLTDINNTSCTHEFIERCRAAGIRPVVGIDFRDAEGQPLYIGLARNAEGFRALNAFLSHHSIEGKALPALAPVLPHTWIIYPKLLKPIGEFGDHELLGIRPEHVARLFGHELREHTHKLVALTPVTFFDDEDYYLHRLLRAIDRNVVLSRLKPRDVAKKNDRLVAPKALDVYYHSCPLILDNTRRVAASCSIEMDTGLHLNRQSFTGSKEGDFQLLQKLARDGCKRRYGALHREAQDRVERELRVIRTQDFCSYFLITWDIIRYARACGYHHVGRGSGANSIVAYCMEITDVDPLELNLFFERFINPYRTSPPDFDIDFSWNERDDVTDYIFKRYGREHTALLATYSTFQRRAVVRELGKVFGLPKPVIDRIVADPLRPESHHELAADILRYGSRLEGFPNHLSIHAGGIIISEKPIHYHTALQMMPKGFPVTHFDMHHAETMGFHKFDVLSQRGLGHIKDAVELIRQNQGRAVNIHDIDHIKNDARTRAQLRSARCMGCFYIESPAMRGLITRLRCDNYIHLVAASSIIRPGVARSGMMREFIHRFHNPDSFDYPHPVFEEQLGETFGVMVYQEDVMKIVHHFAGLDLDESDVLRRIMTGKKIKNDTFDKLQKKYFVNCRARGYPDELSREVWRQIESFSGYSFCKAHSASFAVESFQSLYLKAYFPLEFMVAVINNFGGFYRTEYYVHEARMQGATVHAPCVNHSLYLTTIDGTDIHLGFIHLNGMERAVAHRIVSARAQGGIFRNLADFVQRVEIGAGQLELLIRINAFRFTGKNKYEMMWEKNAVFNPRDSYNGTLPLFRLDEMPPASAKATADGTRRGLSSKGNEADPHALPELREGPHDQAFDEIELLGFPLRSPFELLEAAPAFAEASTGGARRSHGEGGSIHARNFGQHVGQPIRILGYYVCQKTLTTVRKEPMAFGTWLDERGAFFDTTHFPAIMRKYPFRGKGIYLIEGVVVDDFGHLTVDVTRLERLAFVVDGRYGEG